MLNFNIYLCWNVTNTINAIYLIDFLDKRRQTAMNAKNTSIDYRGDRQVIKHLGYRQPNICRVIFFYTFDLKSVTLLKLNQN